MRALLWTSLVILVGIGFGTVLSAEESDKKTADSAGTNTDTDTAVAADTDVPNDTDAPAETDSTNDADGGVPEEPEAKVEPAPLPPEVVVEAPTLPEEPPPKLMYAKGDMDASLGFSLAGDGNVNYLGFTAKFAYYVMDRLAPGLDLRYTNVIGESKTEYGYPDAITLLPLLKFVLSRKQVAPYIFATGGYEWQWGAKSSANAWVLGLGGGVNVSVSKHVMINIELSALHYWYTKKKIYWYNDKDPDLLSMKDNATTKLHTSDCTGNDNCIENSDGALEPAESDVVWVDSENTEYVCTDPATCGTEGSFKDKNDVEREWFFPLISVGVAVTF